jgi:hypothetical protein
MPNASFCNQLVPDTGSPMVWPIGMDCKSFRGDPDKPYHTPIIEMSVELAKSLTYESKPDRRPEHTARLIQDGEEQGRKFLEARNVTAKRKDAENARRHA